MLRNMFRKLCFAKIGRFVNMPAQMQTPAVAGTKILWKLLHQARATYMNILRHRKADEELLTIRNNK